MRRSNLIARMGNVVMTICAFFVKNISAKWAYKYTSYSNPHAEKFLMGVSREVKLLNELAKNPDNLSEIKNHLWSFATNLEILKRTEDENLMKIFVEMMKTSKEWDAAMCNNHLRNLVYGYKSHTPTEQQIIERLSLLTSMELSIFIKAHHMAFTPKVLKHMDADMLNSFIIIMLGKETTTTEQVEFILQKKNKTPKMKEFIEKFFLAMPATAENAEILEKEFPEQMKMWVNRQDANTLCDCCLGRWAANNNEQGLRIIEKKCSVNNSISAAERLVRSTNAFYFYDAIYFLIESNQAKTSLLDRVKEGSVHYYKLVDELLKHPSTLKWITPDQLAKFRDEQKRKYWLKMAESGNLTAEKLKEVPEELKDKVLSILEDNSMIAWLQSHSPVNKRDVEFISNKAISSRVQCAMAKKRVDERWIYTIFSGELFSTFLKSRYRDDINFSISKVQLLSSEAFRILVDNDGRKVLEDYLRVMTSIPEADREYLLCSPLKDMAVGVGTIN